MRGKIVHRNRKRQLLDMSGLRFGKITPSDLDACIEYRRRAWVFIEFKKDGGLPAAGQLRMLQELASDMHAAGKQVAVILGAHGIDDPEVDVVAADVPVHSALILRPGEECGDYGPPDWLMPGWSLFVGYTVGEVAAWFIASVEERDCPPIKQWVERETRNAEKVAAARSLLASCAVGSADGP